jgi:hypothetical protein
MCVPRGRKAARRVVFRPSEGFLLPGALKWLDTDAESPSCAPCSQRSPSLVSRPRRPPPSPWGRRVGGSWSAVLATASKASRLPPTARATSTLSRPRSTARPRSQRSPRNARLRHPGPPAIWTRNRPGASNRKSTGGRPWPRPGLAWRRRRPSATRARSSWAAADRGERAPGSWRHSGTSRARSGTSRASRSRPDGRAPSLAGCVRRIRSARHSSTTPVRTARSWSAKIAIAVRIRLKPSLR